MANKLLIDYSKAEFTEKYNIDIKDFRKHFNEFLDYYELDKNIFKPGKSITSDIIIQCDVADLVAFMYNIFRISPFTDNRRKNKKTISIDEIKSYNKSIFDGIKELPHLIKYSIKESDSYYSMKVVMTLAPKLAERFVMLFATMVSSNTESAAEIMSTIIKQTDKWIDNHFIHRQEVENLGKKFHDSYKMNISSLGNITYNDSDKYTIDSTLKEVLLSYMRNDPYEVNSDIPSSILNSINGLQSKYSGYIEDERKKNTNPTEINSVREKYMNYLHNRDDNIYREIKLDEIEYDLTNIENDFSEKFQVTYDPNKGDAYKIHIMRRLNELYESETKSEGEIDKPNLNDLHVDGRYVMPYIHRIINSSDKEKAIEQCAQEICDLRVKEHKAKVNLYNRLKTDFHGYDEINKSLSLTFARMIYEMMREELHQD